MNGDMVLRHEEKHCERLQTEFLKSKGLSTENWETDMTKNTLLFESQEYFDFVLEDMNG